MQVLGLDLGGTNIKWAVLDSGGGVDGAPRPLGFGSLPTGAEDGPEAVAGRLLEAGRRAIGIHGDVEAIGVGVPGLFDRSTGAIELFPNLPGAWPGFPLRARLGGHFGRPVAIINDARAFTLAEGTLGAGRGCRTLVCITLGTGVGGGVLIDGRLHLGANGRAGEIGHQVVVEDGPPCGCGNRGCVEPLAWAETLARLAGRATAAEVYAGAADGDERCRAAISEAARYLGLGLANVTTVLVPDRIVVGGGISAAGELLLEPLRAAVRARAPLVEPDRIDIVAASLGSEAGAIGAALAALAALEETSAAAR